MLIFLVLTHLPYSMYNIVTDLSTATLINAFKGGVRELANINDIQSRVFPCAGGHEHRADFYLGRNIRGF